MMFSFNCFLCLFLTAILSAVADNCPPKFRLNQKLANLTAALNNFNNSLISVFDLIDVQCPCVDGSANCFETRVSNFRTTLEDLIGDVENVTDTAPTDCPDRTGAVFVATCDGTDVAVVDPNDFIQNGFNTDTNVTGWAVYVNGDTYGIDYFRNDPFEVRCRPTPDGNEVKLNSDTAINVALMKHAWMSSILGNNYASKGVDGDTTTTVSGVIHTDINQPIAWWKVNLQGQVQSPRVILYFRTDFTQRRNGVMLYTSGTNSSDPQEGNLCYNVTGLPDGTDIPDVLNVTCPGIWRYLTVFTETDNGDGVILDFAEVQVLYNPLTMTALGTGIFFDPDSGNDYVAISYDDETYNGIYCFNRTDPTLLSLLFSYSGTTGRTVLSGDFVYMTDGQEIVRRRLDGTDDWERVLFFSTAIKDFDVNFDGRIVFSDDAGALWMYHPDQKIYRQLREPSNTSCSLSCDINPCNSLLYVANMNDPDLEIYNLTSFERVDSLTYTESTPSPCPTIGFDPTFCCA